MFVPLIDNMRAEGMGALVPIVQRLRATAEGEEPPAEITMPNYQAAGVAVEGQGAVSPAWPVGAHATDDIGVIFAVSANEAIALSVAADFAEVTDSPQGTGTVGGAAATRIAAFWCRATSGAMATPTIADPGNHVFAQMLTFRNCVATGDPWEDTAGDTGAADTAVAIPGGVTAAINRLIVAACSSGFDSATGQFSGWTNADLANLAERINAGTALGNGSGLGVVTGEKAAAGAFGATTATLANSFAQGRIMIALKGLGS